VVLGSEPEPARRAAARAFGVRALDPDDVSEAVAAETSGQGTDLVVEASGNPGALASSLGLLAHEGTALVCSWYGTKPVALPLGAEFHRRRLALRSTQVSTLPSALTARWDRRRRRAELAWRLASGLPLSVLATHAFPFEQAAEAYACADRKDDGLIHATLRYQ
jgi:threonine dehydrogenase-like Zn-dependent dehydrogenase